MFPIYDFYIFLSARNRASVERMGGFFPGGGAGHVIWFKSNTLKIHATTNRTSFRDCEKGIANEESVVFTLLILYVSE